MLKRLKPKMFWCRNKGAIKPQKNPPLMKRIYITGNAKKRDQSMPLSAQTGLLYLFFYDITNFYKCLIDIVSNRF